MGTVLGLLFTQSLSVLVLCLLNSFVVPPYAPLGRRGSYLPLYYIVVQFYNTGRDKQLRSRARVSYFVYGVIQVSAETTTHHFLDDPGPIDTALSPARYTTVVGMEGGS